MTVKKTSRSGGAATVVARQKLYNNNQQLDIMTITKPAHQSYNLTVGFNEKDQLQLTTKTQDDKSDSDDEKSKLIKEYTEAMKYENISVDDIINCVNLENYPNCENTLVFYIAKNMGKEAIALKFENEQDLKRIYFTYKYFKMRNRLAKSTSNYTTNDSLFSKKYDFKNRKNSVEDYGVFDKGRSDFDLMRTTDSDGITHISVQQKNFNTRYDQPMSLIGLRSDAGDIGEIDSIIYTDVDIPSKPDRKRLFHKKSKAPSPPLVQLQTTDNMSSKVLKGEFVRVNVERSDGFKENKAKADAAMNRDSKTKRISSPSSLWTASNKVAAGYESDREEWRNSRSQFSTTAFDSLARPTKMALTLRKPQRIEPVQYYRLSSEPTTKIAPLTFRPNNYLNRPQARLPRASPDAKRNLNLSLTLDHRKYASLQNLEIPKKLSEHKKIVEPKKNYNISNRISGLTNKLRDLGNPTNTLGRFKAQSHNDVANLKPVLKNQDGGKRPVVRTCSAEPPKKVTFSAFATVQVV